MKIIKLQGGLGNQMFIYAFGLALQKATSDTVLFDKRFFAERKKREIGNTGLDGVGLSIRSYELDSFPDLHISFATREQIKELRYVYKPNFITRLFKKPIPKQIITENKACVYQADLLEEKGSVYYSGFFQCEKYFSDIEPELKKAFTFNIPETPRNLKMKNSILQAENAVSINIRRGDYLNLAEGTVCSLDYYQKAVDYITSRVDNVSFFVFSDDEHWVREHFTIGHPFQYIHPEGIGGDLYYMTLCKHNVLANSSYSWWGGWLNSNPDKIVIAPDPWIDGGDQICDSWIKLAKHDGTLL